MRGEKSTMSACLPMITGSPPHARGKVQFFRKLLKVVRITPAYAGKRPFSSALTSARKDHPRIRGEKSGEVRHTPRVVGSPPHTRGKVTGFHVLSHQSRITPACAGKRWRGWNCPTGSQDHPRMRGEKSASFSVSSRQPGSPPHVRGKVEAGLILGKALPCTATHHQCLLML